MNRPSVGDSSPPKQREDRDLGEFHPVMHVRMTLHATGPERAVLRRHRVSKHVPPDRVALVIHSGGVVQSIEWDDRHHASAIAWIDSVESWVRAKIAADWADQA